MGFAYYRTWSLTCEASTPFTVWIDFLCLPIFPNVSLSSLSAVNSFLWVGAQSEADFFWFWTSSKSMLGNWSQSASESGNTAPVPVNPNARTIIKERYEQSLLYGNIKPDDFVPGPGRQANSAQPLSTVRWRRVTFNWRNSIVLPDLKMHEPCLNLNGVQLELLFEENNYFSSFILKQFPPTGLKGFSHFCDSTQTVLVWVLSSWNVLYFLKRVRAAFFFVVCR